MAQSVLDPVILGLEPVAMTTGSLKTRDYIRSSATVNKLFRAQAAFSITLLTRHAFVLEIGAHSSICTKSPAEATSPSTWA
jgi:hypothetical protein